MVPTETTHGGQTRSQTVFSFTDTKRTDVGEKQVTTRLALLAQTWSASRIEFVAQKKWFKERLSVLICARAFAKRQVPLSSTATWRCRLQCQLLAPRSPRLIFLGCRRRAPQRQAHKQNEEKEALE